MRTIDHVTTAVRTLRATSDTSSQILDIAERLAQTRGFNGFSYADISQELGITKASLHYHFRTKAELGRRLIARYSEVFRLALDTIGTSDVCAVDKLRCYMDLYVDVLKSGRMCLCGMLAAEHDTLPGPMQEEIRRFFDVNEAWLAEVLGQGRALGALQFSGASQDCARLLLGALEGAMLVARSYGDIDRLEAAGRQLLDAFSPSTTASGIVDSASPRQP